MDAIKRGNTTLISIKESTKACTGNSCKEKNPHKRCCSKEINELIDIYTDKTTIQACSCC